MVEEVKAAVATTLVVSVGLCGTLGGNRCRQLRRCGHSCRGRWNRRRWCGCGCTTGASGAGGLSAGGGAMLPLISACSASPTPRAWAYRSATSNVRWRDRSAGLRRAAHRACAGDELIARRPNAPGAERGENSTSNELNHGAATTAQLAKLLNLLQHGCCPSHLSLFSRGCSSACGGTLLTAGTTAAEKP